MQALQLQHQQELQLLHQLHQLQNEQLHLGGWICCLRRCLKDG
jgi:hypothetical protein